ncbi:alginate lyase [candidate division KSB3 bacterium]|uniref:Alginate lyase n=1 Tax=candidate division KSB3 bacterium TaxID=2044937 RepID=A0A2G6E895_9BACT|nr:MAG: alginate lyase [candidate division KSB3 bacterium]PIE30615.1 MAG: alginate lyase [candidate division KSB3 bacterium]
MTERPDVFCLRAEALQALKAALAKEPSRLDPAQRLLRQQADEALKVSPLSVTDKQRIPPSGDKHDYLSLGLYWWPHPNRRNGLPYCQRDGMINPDNQQGTDRMSLGRMVRTVEILALAYYLLERDMYGEHAGRMLRTWFLDPDSRMNPHLQYAQTIPGRKKITGLGIIDSLTFTCVVDAVGLLRSCRAWTQDDRQGMLDWFGAFLKWLQTSKHGRKEGRRKNNHGLWYHVQIVSYALFLGKYELAEQIVTYCRKRRIKQQILPDGRQHYALQRTRTFHYSTYNLTAWFSMAAMAERLGIDLWNYSSKDGRGIRKALDFLLPYADPGRSWPYEDSSFQRTKLLPLLYRAASVYRDRSYEENAQKFVSENSETNDSVHETYILETFCRARQHQLSF